MLALKRSPFLKMAETFADRQSSGTVTESRDFWKIAISNGYMHLFGEFFKGPYCDHVRSTSYLWVYFPLKLCNSFLCNYDAGQC